MKVTYNWLKDFVAIKILPEALAEKLTLAGLEVTSLEAKDGDFVFEVEITSNRPDWLSVAGIAREVAAITNSTYSVERRAYNKNKEFKLSSILYPLSSKTVKIGVESKKDCPLYTVKIVTGVKAGVSPDWLKRRLELVGCRSVNNIVDITNYILFECGEPLHAFDLDKLISSQPAAVSQQLNLVIRRAEKGEKIITIDGIERILDEDILVIAAGNSNGLSKPVAIAGIMGGKETEVTEHTKNILLEAALFSPMLVRRGRRKLGAQSESSYRFERGVACDLVERASLRALGLIRDIAGGECVFAGNSGLARAKKTIVSLDMAMPERILGVSIPVVKIKEILVHLGFKLLSKGGAQSGIERRKNEGKQSLTVEVPVHREDVKSGIDLVEEIARIFGYERIPSTMPLISPRLTICSQRDSVSLIKNILTGLGMNEVITYSLVDKELLSGFDFSLTAPVEIENPLSKAEGNLRPSLIPSITNCIAYNLNQKQEYLSIFEIAKVFSSHNLGPKEELSLAIGLCGTKTLFLEEGVIKDKFGMLHLKGVLETLLKRLGVVGFSFVPDVNNQGKRVCICVKNEELGAIMALDKNILDKFGIKNKEVMVLEISLDKLLARVDLRRKFNEIPKYPGISRDISFILREEVILEGILETIKEQGKPLLQEVKIIDYYKGKQIPQGFKGVTVSCYYRSGERTLTEEEIIPSLSSISNILVERFDVKIR